MLIYLDAGHGGKDGGAVGNGLKEKDITLKLCKKIQTGLSDYECKVIMSRDTDIYLTLKERTEKANKANADALVSVHVNAAGSTSAEGFETFVYTQASSGSKALQNVMHGEILKAVGSGITDRGKKSKNLHMVRESKMKAILTENLFISNSKDAGKLKDEDFLNKLAIGHILGLVKFFGLRRIDRPPEPIKPQAQKYYKVQVGSFSEKKNAEALADDLKRQGYRPFIKYE